MADKQVLYKCEVENHTATVMVPEKGKKGFNCEVCGQNLMPDLKGLKLGSHGKSADTIKHKLLMVKEVGVEK